MYSKSRKYARKYLQDLSAATPEYYKHTDLQNTECKLLY